MDEIREMFRQLQVDVNVTKNSLKDMETNITRNINNNINEMVGNLNIKIQELEDRNESQERRLDTIERTQRQRNLVLFGVEEEEHGYNDLLHKLLKILKDVMQSDCLILEIEAARRIGRKGDKTRPVILTFTTLGRKIDIQKKWKNLQNTNYSLAEDYPPKILEKRKALYGQAKIEKEKGNKVLIKYDKLIILPPDAIGQSSNITRNSKRTLSKSPQSTSINVQTEITKGATQTHKKNKISSYWSSTHQIDRTANRHNTQAGPSDYYTNKEKDTKTSAQQQKQ